MRGFPPHLYAGAAAVQAAQAAHAAAALHASQLSLTAQYNNQPVAVQPVTAYVTAAAAKDVQQHTVDLSLNLTPQFLLGCFNALPGPRLFFTLVNKLKPKKTNGARKLKQFFFTKKPNVQGEIWTSAPKNKSEFSKPKWYKVALNPERRQLRSVFGQK